MPANLRVNGQARIITVEPRTTPLDALRAGNVANRIIRVDCAFSGPCPVGGRDRTCQAPFRRWHEVIKPNLAHGVASRMDRRVKPGADKEMSSL